MDYLMYLFTAVVLIAATLVGITVWARRAVWIKVSALVLAALLMATAYVGLVELLGKPKPVALEWAMQFVPEATVLGVSMREGESIYLWLQFDGGSEPRAYVLQWRMEIAKQLHQAMQRAETNGTAVRMRRPFESDHNPNEPLFYAEPQPALPPKVPLSLSKTLSTAVNLESGVQGRRNQCPVGVQSSA